MAQRYVFDKPLEETDPDISRLIGLEEERQANKLILIASESICPPPVRNVLNSVFNNIYAEGYASPRQSEYERELLLDYEHMMTNHRRYSDRRYYKGTEFCDFAEALAQKRLAELFATDNIPADQIYCNVQPLSGAAANNAVYDAFLMPGDVVLGLDLTHGGHLTHGSDANRSGQNYEVVAYQVDRATGRLDYEKIRELALEHEPRLIIAGFSAYPWAPDFEMFRMIADEVGAVLLADIAHTAGMAVAGAYPNPIEFAHIISFTTHKTMCGPRGACLVTADPDVADMMNAGVFPGEQGGPHIHQIAAKAVSFKIAQSDGFKKLMNQVAENAQHLAKSLENKGLTLAYGGTDTHMCLVDLKKIKTPTGVTLTGEIASRILDLCHITLNKNTIIGDDNAAHPTAVRLGTTWVTQRGMGKPEMEKIAELVAKALLGMHPFSYIETSGIVGRGKIELDTLLEIRREVAALCDKFPGDVEPPKSETGYPFYYLGAQEKNPGAITVTGTRATQFMQGVCTADVSKLEDGQDALTFFLDKEGNAFADASIMRIERDAYLIVPGEAREENLLTYLRAVSDGYVIFDGDDVSRKIEGPVVVKPAGADLDKQVKALADARGKLDLPDYSKGRPSAAELVEKHPDAFGLSKLYFAGQSKLVEIAPKDDKDEFNWVDPEGEALKRTALFEEHGKLTKKSFIVPFAGWEMPVWYTRVSEEHEAVRETAGLFDVSHMGLFEITGPNAEKFLDTVLSNYAAFLRDGQAMYAYCCGPDGDVIDDTFTYRLDRDHFWMVVNASNTDKMWDWLNGVNDGRYLIDREITSREIEGKAELRNLKDPELGSGRWVNLALQGPMSLDILADIADSEEDARTLEILKWSNHAWVNLNGVKALVARTGYTGEKIAFEIYVPWDDATAFWGKLLETGEDYGLAPCGLGARDSTRTEAGLPLYGHELAGHFGVSPIEAGYGAFVKFHKPFFVGRNALLAKEKQRKMEIVRWMLLDKDVRTLHTGDPVANKRGKHVGWVTSAVLVDGYQMGLAYVDRKFTEPGTSLEMFPLIKPEAAAKEKPKTDQKPGDMLLISGEAEVMTRWPEEDEEEELEDVYLPEFF